MPDQDLTSLDEHKPDGQVDQVLVLDDAEHETRRKLKAWADVEHSLVDGGHTVTVSTMAPVTPSNWQLWFNSETGELLIYHDDYDKWVTVEQPTFNYLYNSDFSRFANATSVPVGWWYYGSTTIGTVVPSGAGLGDTRQKFGPFCLKVSSGDGSAIPYQRIGLAGSSFVPMRYWQNRTVSLGCWVWANVANSAELVIAADTVGFIGQSGKHPGDSTWRWLVAVGKVFATENSSLSVQLYVSQPSTTAYFSGPTFVEGSWCPRVVPSGIVLRSEVLHMGSPSGALDSTPGTSVYYGPQGSAPVAAQAIATAPFRALISNMRVYVTSAPGSGKTYAARLIVDGADTPLTCTVADLNTFAFINSEKVVVNASQSLSTRVFGTAGSNVTAIRISYLVEEIPLGLL